MNILTYNKEMKEKIKKILNEKKNEKREPTKVDLEIQIEKKYANNEEHKYIIEDLANLIFGQNIGIYKFLEIESFLLGENSDDFLTKNLLEILNNSMKENHKENIENHKISKIMFLLTLIIIIISFFGHYNNWSYSFWNKNIFLLVLNVILVIVAIIITLVTYIFLYEINKYNKRYNLKRNNFFEISLGITLLIIGAMHFYFKSLGNTDYSNGYKEVPSYSQPQAQQEVKPVIAENKTEREEVVQQSSMQTSNSYDYDLEVLEKVYNEVINRGNESYLESFSSEELAIIRNTLYARKGYQFNKKEYQEYFGQKSWYNPTTTNQNILSKDEEKLANIIKKYENNTSANTSNVTYSNYYNSYYGYSMDYPTSSDFYISSNTNDGIEIESNDENVYISVSYGYDEYGDNLQQAYNRAVLEYPNAPYKFLGKTFFTITYEEDDLLVFRKTVYDRANNGYIYLYVSFPPEYKEYMTPIVEKMANTMKKR